MKKQLAMLLILCLTLTPLTAFASAANTSEPITLTIYATGTGPVPITSGLQDDVIAKAIEDNLGIRMEFELNNDANKTTAMVASGDLFDITVLTSLDQVEPLVKSNAVMAMDDYLDLAPNLQQNAPKTIQYSRDVLSDGTGKLFVLPMRGKTEPSPVLTAQNGNFMRWDYYTEIGAPDITSLRSFVDVVSQIVENHPINDDGKKVYGFQFFLDWGIMNAYTNGILSKYLGQQTVPGGMGHYTLTDKEFLDFYDDRSIMWQSIEMYNYANQKGVLDPESFIQKFENAKQKLAEDRIVTATAQWYIEDINPTLPATGSFVDVPFVDTADFPAWYDRSSPFGMTGRMIMISAKCAYPEKAMQLIDYLFSEDGVRTLLTGPEGTIWQQSGGRYALTDTAKTEAVSDPDFRAKYAIHKYEGIVGFDYDAFDSNGQLYDLFLEPEYLATAYTDAERDYMQHYGADSVIGVIGNRENRSTVNEGFFNLMPTVVPTDISRTATKITNYLNQEIPNAINAPDDDAFRAKKQEIRDELKKLGYDAVRDYYKSALEDAVKKYDEY